MSDGETPDVLAPARPAAAAGFLPVTVIEALSRSGDGALDTPEAGDHCAVLCADVTGFTPLMERMSHRGPRGAEIVRDILDACFGKIIALIDAHGGDLVDLAGDAALAVWTAPDAAGLARAVDLAARCALRIVEAVDNFAADGDHTLRLHLGLSAGTLRVLHLGGVRERWFCLFVGDPFPELAPALSLARSGEVVLTPRARELLAPDAASVALDGGFARLLRPGGRAPEMSPRTRPPVGPEAEARITRYLDPALVARLASGLGDWLSEFRRMSVAFVNFPDLDLTAEAGRCRFDGAVRDVQAAVNRYEGRVHQILMDDKGCVAVLVFGLPPYAHEDDPVRAARAVGEIRDALTAAGIAHGIGLTTGVAFAGAYGNAVQRRYSVVGDIVNLSARLMQVGRSEVTCDEKTYLAARAKLAFEALPPLKLKGRATPTAAYRLSHAAAVEEAAEGPALPAQIVGREAEMAALTAALERALAGDSVVALVEGEAGIGKSTLLHAFVERSRSRVLTVVHGEASAVEASTPLHALRRVFRVALGILPGFDPDAVRASLAARVASLATPPGWLPLLSTVLPFEIAENDVTVQMDAPIRAESTRALLAALLASLSPGPTLFVVDDVQWLDSASWAVLAAFAALKPREMLLVYGSRPVGDHAAEPYRQLRDDPAVTRVALEEMGRADVAALVMQRLGASAIDPTVEEYILTRAGGQPLFSEELAYMLRDAGLVAVVDGTARLTDPSRDLSAFSAPDTVQGVITARLDRLSPSEQLAAKVASVVGRSFLFDTVREVYPVEGDRENVAPRLRELERVRLTLAASTSAPLSYLFRHALIHDVVYGMLAFAQRRQLHGAIARWLEATPEASGGQYAPLLAHHWRHAEDFGRCVDYLEIAGDDALKKGANKEAALFFGRAVEIAAEHGRELGAAVDDLRRARWQMQIGEALNGLGELRGSEDHYKAALALVGEAPLPLTEKWGQRCAREAARQVWHVAASGRARAAVDEAQQQRWKLAAHIAGVVSEHCYYNVDILGWLTSTLASVNYAERAGEPRAAARAYGSMGYLSGTVGMHGLTKRYFALGRLSHDARALNNTDYAEGLYHMSYGRWEPCFEAFDAGLRRAVLVGDSYSVGIGYSVLALAQFYRGRFRDGLETDERLMSSARGRSDRLQECWGTFDSIVGLIAVDDLARAEERLRAGHALTQKANQASVIRHWGLGALVHTSRGDLAKAKEFADNCLAIVRGGVLPAFEQLYPFQGTAEAYLALWDEGARDATTRAALVDAVGGMKKIAGQFPIFVSAARRLEAEMHHRLGNGWRAKRALTAALEVADRLRLDHERAAALVTRARWSDGDARRADLTEARRLFEAVGHARHVRAIDALAY